MKKITHFSITGLVAMLALLGAFGSTGIAQAQNSPENPGTNMPQYTVFNVGNSTKTQLDVEAFVKAENARCAAMATDAQKRTCAIQISTNVRAKFPGLFADVNGNGGVTNKNINRDGMVPGSAREPGSDNKDGKDNMGDKKDDATRLKNLFANFTMHFSNVTDRLTAMHDRLSTISDRIESRMKKLSAQGTDISASTKLVASARSELALAKTSTDAATASFKIESAAAAKMTTTPANLRATVFAKTIANIQAAKDHLKKAHDFLVQAVMNLKPGSSTPVKASVDAKVNASAAVDMKSH